MNRQASQKKWSETLFWFCSGPVTNTRSKSNRGEKRVSLPDIARSQSVTTEARAGTQVETQEEFVCGLPHSLSQFS